jgi:hypothetical protein
MNTAKHNDTRLSNQWASRPNDERFLSMADLYAAVSNRYARSLETRVHSLDVVVNDEELQIVGPGKASKLTHWSFGQLARLGGAPADYLRSLPPVLAAPALQWSLEERIRERGELVALTVASKDGGEIETRAITSRTYGRVFDKDFVQAMMQLGPDWHVPASSYTDKDPLRATTLYASDRDVFIFLCRQEAIEVGGSVINRGVMGWNSETGSASVGLAAFTYDRVCDNRIIWGVSDSREIRIRHTSGAPGRLVREVRPAIEAYARASAAPIAATIKAAQAAVVGKDRASVEEWMRKKGFTKAQATGAYESARRDERSQGLNPNSVWGLVQGATDVAHKIAHTDTRVAVERAAGELLEAVAA